MYNLTPSEPHESIVNFIESTKPDSVIISMTLEDSIRPGQRLSKKISERRKVPIFVGGQALENKKIQFENAQIVTNSSLKEITKIVISRK